MKNFFVFTLTLLFATTCLLIVNLPADDDYEWGSSDGDYGDAPAPFENVYGYTWVTCWYDTDTSHAYSSHHFFLTNEGWRSVRWYSHFWCDMDDPFLAPKEKKDDGWVEMNEEDSDSEVFSYDMAGKRKKMYTIEGFTNLQIKGDFDGNGTLEKTYTWRAYADHDFELD